MSSTTTTAERRFLPSSELRVAVDGTGATTVRRITGHAALFNSASEDLGGFREYIAPGAFRDAIAGSDIRALFNHDANYVLGRVRAGTLSVSEDERGLAMDCTPPSTGWALDLLTSMERGDIDQQSFGFRVAKGGDEWEERDGQIVRTIHRVAELLDVSVVTYPAYPATDAAVRSMEQWKSSQTVVVVPPAVLRDLQRRRLALAMR